MRFELWVEGRVDSGANQVSDLERRKDRSRVLVLAKSDARGPAVARIAPRLGGHTLAMDVTHTLAAGLSVSRIGLGAILLARPSAVSGFWIGRSGRTPGTQVVARGFGGRDLALGLGGLRALARHRDEEARAWLAGQALADAVDAVATVAAGDKLPERRRRIALAMAAGGAVTGAVSAALLGRGAAPAASGGLALYD